MSVLFQLCKELAEEHDKIRRRYWEYMSQQLNKILEGTTS